VSTARRRLRRRPRTALNVLLLLIVLAAAGAALYPVWTSAHSETHELSVRYRTGRASSATEAAPWLDVVNSSPRTMSLSDVVVRYYFTADGTSAYGANCVQASVGCSDITEKIATPPSPKHNADHYLQIGFTAGAGSLAPGKSTRAIGLQLYRVDHGKLNQVDDYSFNPKDTGYAPSDRVTGYLRGALVWGTEPSGRTAPAGRSSPSAAPLPAVAAAPPGVMFDDFHYSGPADPALSAHGWQIRTDGGGPGIDDTWSTTGISFPPEANAQGGQALQLRVSTDGTKKGTRQSELKSTTPEFFTGTLAARVYFSNQPTSGRDGDHINETFYAISPTDSSPHYSELDNEYLPNGGWGAPGPELDTTSWHSAEAGDRVTHALKGTPLQGWHIVTMTAVNGVATYSLDGHALFSSTHGYFPRERMDIDFSAWLIDLPFTGERTWDMRVNWVYSQAGRAVSLTNVEKAVGRYYAAGTNYVDTMPRSH
jgi:Cellulose binding domain